MVKIEIRGLKFKGQLSSIFIYDTSFYLTSGMLNKSKKEPSVEDSL
jgi:hypothetical protein